MGVQTREGKLASLKLMLSKPLILRLYENNVYPTYHSGIDDFREASGGGYAVKILEPDKWKYGFMADAPIATYPDQLFEFSGPVGFVYGFFVTDEDRTLVRWASRFADGPYEVLRIGDTVKVQTRVRLPKS